MVSKKPLKIKRGKDPFSNLSGRLIFFFGLELEQTFLCWKFTFPKYCKFQILSKLYHCKGILCHFTFRVFLKHPLPTLRLISLLWKGCFHSTFFVFRKKIVTVLFLSSMSEKQEITINESLEVHSQFWNNFWQLKALLKDKGLKVGLSTSKKFALFTSLKAL